MSARARRAPAAALLAGAVTLGAAAAHAQESWTHYARSPERLAAGHEPPASIASPARVTSHDANGAPIEFAGQSGPVVHDGRVFALARIAGQTALVAIDAGSGETLWTSPVPSLVQQSWSSPAVDTENGTVLAAAGRELRAFDAATGELRWSRPLQRDVVNASPAVTTDRGPADRAFITDYDGIGASGRLYCVNVDPYDPALNPYEPGQIVWSVVLGATSGNSPAYANGAVYVSSITDDSGWSPGIIRAFPAGAMSPPSPLWTFENVKDAGFFGGVCVVATPEGSFVYAASYATAGGQFSANLVKLDAATGSLVWSIDANRTDAVPIPLGDGRLALSTGVRGFGSTPSVQLFRDDGASATMLWDTALATWNDADGDGLLDVGEFLLVGGWTVQPVWAGDGDGRLYVGAAPGAATWFGPCTDLYALDVAKAPGDEGFIAEHFAGAGSTPALTGGVLYTIGAAGLHAFGGCAADCDGSGSLSVADFTCFRTRYLAGDPRADCTGDGALSVADFTCFRSAYLEGCP